MRSGLRPRVLLVAAGLLLVGGACTANPGIDPPLDEFFFTTGVALDPLTSVLYVTNGNADIRYNAGTLNAIDLQEYHCRREGACEGVCVDDNRVERPCCVADARNPFWADCEESLVRIAPDGSEHPMIIASVGVGSYALTPVVNSSGTRLYVPVRGDPSLTFVELRRGADGRLRALECGQSRDPGAGPMCDEAHRVAGRGEELAMPSEPFGIFLDERRNDDPPQLTPSGEPLGVELIYLTHQTTGEVSVFCAPPPSAPPVLMTVVGGLFMPDPMMRFGATSVARQPGTELLYVTSRTNNYVATIARYTDLPLDNRCDPASYQYAASTQISLASLDTGADSRFIAFAPDGSQAYVSQRLPSSLVVINTPRPGVPADPRTPQLMPIEVCDEPSTVAVRETEREGRLVYVVCFAARTLYVVSPELGAVVDIIQLPDGPNSIALDPPDTPRPFGYLAGFRENTVAVLDLDPDSPSYHQVIGLIGTPQVQQ